MSKFGNTDGTVLTLGLLTALTSPLWLKELGWLGSPNKAARFLRRARAVRTAEEGDRLLDEALAALDEGRLSFEDYTAITGIIDEQIELLPSVRWRR